MRRPTNKKNVRTGAAAVEAALLLPLLTFLLLIALDYCRIFYYTQAVQNCAYAGALSGSNTGGSDLSDKVAAENAAIAEGTNLGLKADQVTYSAPDANKNIQVTVTYTFQALLPLDLSFGGVQFQLSKDRVITRTVTMRYAPIPSGS